MARLAFTAPLGEPALPRAERRALGVYYTPPEIVRLIVEMALAPQLKSCQNQPPQVLDPACGAGEFLAEAQRVISRRLDDRAARSALHGVDIDPAAIVQARLRLQAADASFPAGQLILGDALDPQLLPAAAFDVIVGNPPYVSIRQLAKSAPRERVEQLRQRYHTARGNFDLYVLFIERALQFLRPGGRCGLIIPNKWATLDYARACRELLLRQTTIEQVVDLSDARPFAAASVYPQIVVFQKTPPSRRHVVSWRPLREAKPQAPPCRMPAIYQSSLSAAAISFAAPLDLESRVLTQPLGELATVCCGTPGYAAQRIAERLSDGESPTTAEFITSGNIDRYAIRLGHVRYLNRTYKRPKLALDIAELTAARRRLFREPKIVIAGMSRRLEAAFDERGLALGVQVFAATQIQVDPHFLLALLNSKLLSYVFATRFAAKRLGGGYLAINKGQLVRLPICLVGKRDARARRLSRLAQARSRIIDASQATQPVNQSAHPAELERELDKLVFDLYQLRAAELSRVEEHFAEAAASNSRSKKSAA